MRNFDVRESTVSYCYRTKTVEFYLTKQSEYEKLKRRNPHYVTAQDLNPGYRVVYPFDQVRTTDYLLRVPKTDA